ncbi:MAG TPA: ABC transporter permease [Anaerolineales bacterium]|nr:ABC transporter permease [Anaerolineales bacterium]
MVIKNLLRRRGRTLLTVVGIAIGVAAIVGLGALADAWEAGYTAMLSGSQADLVVSQPNSFDITFSSVEESVGEQLVEMPEVRAVSGMLQGFISAEGVPFFFVFGYPQGSFALERFQIIEGVGLGEHVPGAARGKAILLGSAAAEAMDRKPGDTLRLVETVYRVAGIYQTGDGMEDSGGVLELEEAQALLGKPRQVSLFYVQLKDARLGQRLTERVERVWDELSVSTTEDFNDKQIIDDALRAYVWGIGGIAILIGAVGMMNAQLMAVSERTREIGVLRAVGWSRRRVLLLILMESLVVCLFGGLLGIGLGALALTALGGGSLFGAGPGDIGFGLLIQALITVATMGVAGGLYPAWRASRLAPVEALRYEGGSAANVRRLPWGGLALQNLWQRPTRTLLTLGAIAITVGSVMALEAIIRGAAGQMDEMAIGSDAHITLRQADVADTSMSAIDERTGDRLAALPEVQAVSGMILTAVLMPGNELGYFLLEGYAPNSFALDRFRIVEGRSLSGNHQILLGKTMAEALNHEVGDTLDLAGRRYKIVGIYESGIGWEEIGGIVSLREAQEFAGRPHKVTMYALRLREPTQATQLVEKINAQFSDIHASLSGDFAEEMPDMQRASDMLNGISFMAILVGGVGVLNTMLMSVHERTREIGVLRALGWGRRAVLSLILREAVLLGLGGAVGGILTALAIPPVMGMLPYMEGALAPAWAWDVFARAFLVAGALGLAGGVYPAYRATRLQPVEALRYE